MIGIQAFRFAIAVLVFAFASATPRTALAQSEGIKVHGRWAIEVQNPDGTVAQRVEFNNALTTGGAQNLVSLLGRVGTPGRWEVILIAPPGGASPCQGGTGGKFPNTCRLIELAATNFTGGSAESRNLIVSPTMVGGAGSNVRMTGSITAVAAGAVGRVMTSFGVCSASTLTSECNNAGSAVDFSDASLGFPGYPPVVTGIVAGQIIQVTVTFTFS